MGVDMLVGIDTGAGGAAAVGLEAVGGQNGDPGLELASPQGYVPRTQDSGFSIDGLQQGGSRAERSGSGDSLASLPKLQPVHRLTRPDLKHLHKIGEGAFGEVSLASAPLYGNVAVKWLKSDRVSKHMNSFWREAAMLSDLNHPNVLRFYGVVTESAADATVVGIMTEYIHGGSLAQFLRTSHNLLPLRLRCELALGACNGLAYLHELRIVHFDLKPDNLLLDGPPTLVRAAASAGTAPVQMTGLRGSSVATDASGLTAAGHGLPPMSSYGGSSICASSGMEPSHQQHYQQQPRVLGSTSRGGPGSVAGTVASINSSDGLLAAVAAGWAPAVKVADFGLSKHKLNNYVSSCRDLRGTLPYMAPELVADPERVSEKADVWSLGVVMWEMLTREMPYQDLSPQNILMGLMCGNLHLDVPEWCEPEWRGLLEACLEPNPSNRPSMKELAKQLEAIRDQQQQQQAEQQQLLQEQQQQLLQQQQRAEWQPSVHAVTCNVELQQQQQVRLQQLNCSSQQQHQASGHQGSPTWQGLAQ